MVKGAIQLVPSLGDTVAVQGVSANAMASAGAETGWSTDPAGLTKRAAVGREGGGGSRLCMPKSLRREW